MYCCEISISSILLAGCGSAYKEDNRWSYCQDTWLEVSFSCIFYFNLMFLWHSMDNNNWTSYGYFSTGNLCQIVSTFISRLFLPVILKLRHSHTRMTKYCRWNIHYNAVKNSDESFPKAISDVIIRKYVWIFYRCLIQFFLT